MGWNFILTVISFDDCYTDGLKMLLEMLKVSFGARSSSFPCENKS